MEDFNGIKGLVAILDYDDKYAK